MKIIKIQFLIALLFLSCGCSQNQKKSESTDDLFTCFVNPPMEAHPFVRWWWNGDRVSSEEIKRELDVMHSAGIGGIEINPITFPEGDRDAGIKSVEWLSKEWNRLVVLAAQEAKKRGMQTDLVVGSGWPFGGEFLTEDEMIQRIIINKISYSGGDIINETSESLVKKAIKAQSRKETEEARKNEIFFLKLVPQGASATDQVIDLSDKLKSGDKLQLTVPYINLSLFALLKVTYNSDLHQASLNTHEKLIPVLKAYGLKG